MGAVYKRQALAVMEAEGKNEKGNSIKKKARRIGQGAWESTRLKKKWNNLRTAHHGKEKVKSITDPNNEQGQLTRTRTTDTDTGQGHRTLTRAH